MTPPPRQPRVQYEALVSAYQKSLTTVLRGFRSTEEFEFLETWVHEDDDASSILNIVEAAKDAQLTAVHILIGQETLRTLDLLRLDDRARQLGEVTTQMIGQELELTVSFHDRIL